MKINIDKKAVGIRIKQLRLNKGYTLEEFGKLFGASKGNIQQWENGKSLPNKERIKQISKLADITVNELLYGSVEEFLSNNYEYAFNEFITISENGKKEKHSFFINETDKKIIISETKKLTNINELDKILEIFEELTFDYYNHNAINQINTSELLIKYYGWETYRLIYLISNLNKEDENKVTLEIIKMIKKYKLDEVEFDLLYKIIKETEDYIASKK